MTRAQRIRSSERFRMRFEKMYVPQIQEALKERIRLFVNDLTIGGLEYAKERLDVTVKIDSLTVVLRKLYAHAALSKAESVFKQINREPLVKKDITDPYKDSWFQQILDYFNRHLFDKVVLRIEQTTKQQIRYMMERMTTEGRGIDWLAFQLENGDDMTVWRARMIARTESGRAINYGAHLGADDSGFYTNKEWVSVHDDRVRHSHILLDGVVVPFEKEFKQNLMYPGDPAAPGSETINCRCFLEYKGVRDQQGRLIPKKKLPGFSQSERVRAREIYDLIQSNLK